MHKSIMYIARYEHLNSYTILDIASVLSGGLVLPLSPTDTVPALALSLQRPETVTVISEAAATCQLGST